MSNDDLLARLDEMNWPECIGAAARIRELGAQLAAANATIAIQKSYIEGAQRLYKERVDEIAELRLSAAPNAQKDQS